MAMGKVKGVTYTDKPSFNYHPILHFPSALEPFILFQLIVLVLQFYCSGSVSPLSSTLFPAEAAIRQKVSNKPTVRNTPSTKRQAVKVSE